MLERFPSFISLHILFDPLDYNLPSIAPSSCAFCEQPWIFNL